MKPLPSNDISEFLTRVSTQEFLIAAKKSVDILEDKALPKDVFLKLSHLGDGAMEDALSSLLLVRQQITGLTTV